MELIIYAIKWSRILGRFPAGAFGHDGGDFGSCVFAEEAGDLFREPCGEVSDEYAGEDVGGIVDAEVKSREGDERGENEHNNAEFLRQVMVEDESSSEGPVGRAVDQDLKAAVGVKGAGTLDQVLQDAVGKNDIDDKREHRRKSCFSAFPDGHQKDGKGDPDIAVIPQVSHEFQKARQNRRAEGVLDQVQDSYIKMVITSMK